jgi:hypothetical protein
MHCDAVASLVRRSGPDIGQLTDVPIWPPGLGCRAVDEPLAELAGYFGLPVRNVSPAANERGRARQMGKSLIPSS